MTTTSYNLFNQPLVVTEAAGSTTRTTTTGYDPAGRVLSRTTAVTPTAAGGTALPAVSYGYDNTTGLQTTTTAGGQTLTSGFDTLGRVTAYTDATGNTASTSYDLSGRPATVNDGKGTYTYTYDSASEHRGLLTGEDVGVAGSPSVFTATYNADGGVAGQTYPNGVVATTSYNNAADATALAYAKGGSTWLSFTQTPDAHGNTVKQTSPVSSQVFGYDAAGRLTSTQDTYQGACTTRQYSLDANSNRTQLASFPADGTGGCSTATAPSAWTGGYDAADRLINAGYGYDTLGRTTTVPAADAHGSGSHASIAGDLTVGYFANDLVASQAQGGSTVTFSLDPAQNRFAASSDGTTTTTNHFADGGDSPAWTSTGSASWSRNLLGIGGDLAGTVDQAGAVVLNAVNLHGDIVATMPDTTTATGVSTYFETTEYGVPRNPAVQPDSYGWLGGKRRSGNDLGGLTLMGVRLYNPGTGRFLSVDPVPGGTDNPYVYVLNPTDQYDLNGQWWSRRKVWRGAQRTSRWFFRSISVSFNACAGFIVGGCLGVTGNNHHYYLDYSWSGHNRAFYGASAGVSLGYGSTRGTSYCFSANWISGCHGSNGGRSYALSGGFGVGFGSTFGRRRQLW